MKQKKRKLSFDSDDEEDENRIPIEVVNKLVYDYLHQVRVVNLIFFASRRARACYLASAA